jgi:hypothetical protein
MRAVRTDRDIRSRRYSDARTASPSRLEIQRSVAINGNAGVAGNALLWYGSAIQAQVACDRRRLTPAHGLQ